MELYRWQRNALNIWRAHGGRGIVQAATGTGKTVFALAAVDALLAERPDLVIKVVVPTIPLARQWSEALLRHMPEEELRPGFVGDGIRDPSERRVLIYIVNSARDCLARHIRREMALGHPVMLICDECHHYESPQNRRIFDFVSPQVLAGSQYYALGLSATPLEPEEDSVMTEALGGMIFRYDLDSASRDGVLSPFVVGEVATSFQKEELERYLDLSRTISVLMGRLTSRYPELKGLDKSVFLRRAQMIATAEGEGEGGPATAFLRAAFERKKLTNLAQSRSECCQALLEQLPPERRTLIFCERISQAEETAVRIRRKWGNVCGVYHSGLTKDARKRILSEFRDKRIRILISCRCLDEGMDVPDAETAIVMSSTAMSRQRIQRLGRILRRAPEKSAASLYYVYIRESSDDTAYLPDMGENESFSVRYHPAEKAFTNEYYEYAAQMLLSRCREKGYSDAALAEVRKCVVEGQIRGDCLLPESAILKSREKARTVHERNYWKTMGMLAGRLAGQEKKAPSQRLEGKDYLPNGGEKN